MNGVVHITDRHLVRGRPLANSTALTRTVRRAPMGPAWQMETIAKIRALASLTDNWDGYGSARLDPGVLAFAEALVRGIRDECMPTAHVGPESGGAIQIEWATRTRCLELHLLRDLAIEYLLTDSDVVVASGTLRGPPIDELVDGVAQQVQRLLRG